MLKISKIDDRLSIYRNNDVYVWGAGINGRYIVSLLKWFEIEVKAFIDNSYKLQGTFVNGIEVISPDILYENIKNKPNSIIQIGLNSQNELEILNDLKGKIIEYILYEEACNRLLSLKKRMVLQNGNFRENQIWELKRFFDYVLPTAQRYFTYNVDKEYLLMCMPPKTGNKSLINSFKSMNLEFCNIWHSPYVINNIRINAPELWKRKKVKIITAVREPISQNLSMLFQGIDYRNHFVMRDEFWTDGGDAQRLFELFLQNLGYVDEENNFCRNQYDEQLLSLHCSNCFLIQQFIPDFQKNVIDLLEMPFDKDKGYDIITKDNMEVFVFQLEKISQISFELGRWIGCDKFVLDRENIRENSWLRDSYLNACKNIKISKTYFDKCFSEPYLVHYYNKEDINKFKERWIEHIY